MISWGLVGLDLSGFLGPVGLVRGMQQVRSMCAQFGYRWDACKHWPVLATGVTPGSLSCYKLACHYFSTLTEYFMYSHLPYFLYIATMLYCSEDEEYFDEDFF
jgi:hypothetical protein